MQYNFIIFLVDIRDISIDPISSYSMTKRSMPFIVTVFKNDLSVLSFNLSKAALMAEEKVEPSACIGMPGQNAFCAKRRQKRPCSAWETRSGVTLNNYGSGYHVLANNILRFNDLRCLPTHLEN